MLTNVTQNETHLKSLFNDFTVGEIKDDLSNIEIDFIIERYYQASQKHINLRDGESSNRTVLISTDEKFVYLSADTEFKYHKADLIRFMKHSASINKNSLITNAFRQSTHEGFKAFLEIQELY